MKKRNKKNQMKSLDWGVLKQFNLGNPFTLLYLLYIFLFAIDGINDKKV